MVRKSLVAIAVGTILWAALFVYVRASEGCFIGYDDQRLMDIAIEYEISGGRRSIDNGREISLVAYRSVEEFREKNKRCCTVERSHFEKTYAPDRAIGYTEVWIDLWYRAAESGPEPYYDSRVGLNRCGKVLASYGMTLAQGPVAE